MAFETIASGVASIHVRDIIVVDTTDSEKIAVAVTRGDKELPLVKSDWIPMHGAVVDRIWQGKYLKQRVHAGTSITFMASGAWKVQVEKPEVKYES